MEPSTADAMRRRIRVGMVSSLLLLLAGVALLVASNKEAMSGELIALPFDPRSGAELAASGDSTASIAKVPR